MRAPQKVNFMQLLAQLVHPGLAPQPRRVLHRRAARGIVLRGQQILLLYTARYDDYSLPGGGVDSHEDLRTGLCRELEEETGARNVQVLADFGRVDEQRPHRHPDFDTLHMQSFVYHCTIDDDLGPARMEHYEQANGMRALWIDLHAALTHNRGVMARAPSSMGQSIQRETLLLERIAAELLATPAASGAAL